MDKKIADAIIEDIETFKKMSFDDKKDSWYKIQTEVDDVNDDDSIYLVRKKNELKKIIS